MSRTPAVDIDLDACGKRILVIESSWMADRCQPTACVCYLDVVREGQAADAKTPCISVAFDRSEKDPDLVLSLLIHAQNHSLRFSSYEMAALLRHVRGMKPPPMEERPT